MKKLLRKCVKCGRYTLQAKCPSCGEETFSPHPAKFSPDDRYVRLRIMDKYKSSPASFDLIDKNSSERSGSRFSKT